MQRKLNMFFILLRLGKNYGAVHRNKFKRVLIQF